MTDLLPLFTEAFMAERGCYAIYGNSISCTVIPVDLSPLEPRNILHQGTRADCERFVVDRCARKGFEALADALPEELREVIWKEYTRLERRDAPFPWPADTHYGDQKNMMLWGMKFALRFLAAEPETTNGDEK